MPDSFFHESMRQEITCSVSFCLFVFSYLFVVCFIYLFTYLFIYLFFAGWYFCFPQDERDGFSFITITSVDVGKS